MTNKLALAAAILVTVLLGGLAFFGLSAPAAAQTYTGRILCEARSNFAIGIGAAYNQQQACQIALYQCAIRTPRNDRCYVTRSAYEVN